jgi:hypothetical protein
MEIITEKQLEESKHLPVKQIQKLSDNEKDKFITDWKDSEVAKKKIQSLSNWWVDFLIDHSDYLKKCIDKDKQEYGKISPLTLKMISDFDNMKNNAEKRFNIDQIINIGQINNISLGMIAEKISESNKKKIIDVDKDGKIIG